MKIVQVFFSSNTADSIVRVMSIHQFVKCFFEYSVSFLEDGFVFSNLIIHLNSNDLDSTDNADSFASFVSNGEKGEALILCEVSQRVSPFRHPSVCQISNRKKKQS